MIGNPHATLDGSRYTGKACWTAAVFGVVPGLAFAVGSASLANGAWIHASILDTNVLTRTVLVIGTAISTKTILAGLSLRTLLIGKAGYLTLSNVALFSIT